MTVEVTSRRGTSSVALAPSTRMLGGANLPLPVTVAIMNVRADGVPLAATRPIGRAGLAWNTLLAQYDDPGGLLESCETLEVDIIWSVFAEPVPAFQRGLPGPPQAWPKPLASRRITVASER